MLIERKTKEIEPVVAGKAVDLKLYGAYSIVDGIIDRFGVEYHQVRVDWYYQDRKAPAIPYELLIKVEGYKSRDQREKLGEPLGYYAEDSVDESFTQDEIEQLRAYLGKINVELTVEEVPLPIIQDIFPLGAIGSGVHDGSFNLYDDRNLRWPTPGWARNAWPYSLPFKVCGYFDLEMNAEWQRMAEAIVNDEEVN